MRASVLDFLARDGGGGGRGCPGTPTVGTLIVGTVPVCPKSHLNFVPQIRKQLQKWGLISECASVFFLYVLVTLVRSFRPVGI